MRMGGGRKWSCGCLTGTLFSSGMEYVMRLLFLYAVDKHTLLAGMGEVNSCNGASFKYSSDTLIFGCI